MSDDDNIVGTCILRSNFGKLTLSYMYTHIKYTPIFGKVESVRKKAKNSLFTLKDPDYYVNQRDFIKLSLPSIQNYTIVVIPFGNKVTYKTTTTANQKKDNNLSGKIIISKKLIRI
jgi:hypothetical protein